MCVCVCVWVMNCFFSSSFRTHPFVSLCMFALVIRLSLRLNKQNKLFDYHLPNLLYTPKRVKKKFFHFIRTKIGRSKKMIRKTVFLTIDSLMNNFFLTLCEEVVCVCVLGIVQSKQSLLCTHLTFIIIID